MSEEIETKIIHYLAQRPDFEGVSTRDIEICNWVADQLKSQLDKSQRDLEREQKCVELAVSALEKLKLGWLYWPANRQPDPRMTMYESKDLHQIENMAYEAITKIKSLRDEK